MAVLSSEVGLLLITFSCFHSIVGTGQVQLGELFGLSQLIQGLINEGQQVSIFDCEVIEAFIMNTQLKATIWLLIEKNKSTCRKLKRLNKPGFNEGPNISL